MKRILIECLGADRLIGQHYREIKIAGYRDLLCYAYWSRMTGLRMKAGEKTYVVLDHAPTYYKSSVVALRWGHYIRFYKSERLMRNRHAPAWVMLYRKWLRLTGWKLNDEDFVGFVVKRAD